MCSREETVTACFKEEIMQINNNTTAFSAWKNYTSNTDALRSSMSKLSSGSRITNAGDDPSGLAMSERLRTQTRNTSAAAGNVENKLNYLQTADSWMQKIHDMMGRMSEWAVRANDGTKAQTDRDVLQKEFGQMQDEIQRITSGATAAGKFNGLYLFRGGTGVAIASNDSVQSGKISVQIGADAGMEFKAVELDLSVGNSASIGDYTTYSYNANMSLSTHTTNDVKWRDLLIAGNGSNGGLSISTQSAAANAVGKMQVGIDFVSEKRAVLGAEMKRMNQTLDGLRNYEENIRATESRIRDVDVAAETTQMSKYQILQQVGTAMLAQANQLPNAVMQLVG
jgi:flagellin